MRRVVLLDNIDSFVFNVEQALRVAGADVEVVRNDQVRVEDVLARSPDLVVVSPGPGRPEEAGICVPLVRAALRERIPLVGVCLGHQALVHVLGGRIVHAKRLVHGKSDGIVHDGKGVFEGLPNPFVVGRYHSLAADSNTLPNDLEVSASATDGEVMAVRHRTLPAIGVQFHPESILCPEGPRWFANVMREL